MGIDCAQQATQFLLDIGGIHDRTVVLRLFEMGNHAERVTRQDS